MIQSTARRRVYRVLLAVERPDTAPVVLQSITVLASGAPAELMGLFVEDINLVRLAGLPIAREIVYRTASERSLESPQLERQLKAQASLARRALESLATALRTQWSFTVVRGEVASEILAAAGEADLVVAEVPAWPEERRARLPPRALLSAAAELSRTVLLLPVGAAHGGPVLVLFDGSPRCAEVLDTAARVADAGQEGLTVLIPVDALEPPQTLQIRAEEALQAYRKAVRFQWLVPSDVRTLANAVRRQGAGMLIISAEHPLNRESSLAALLGRIHCPLLLVGCAGRKRARHAHSTKS